MTGTGVCAVGVVVGMLSMACSSPESTEARSSAPPPAPSGPAADPCGLLTDAEVRTVFPNAARGTLDRRLEGYGILSCTWDHPRGQFVAQSLKGEPAAVEDEIRSRASGAVDPTIPAAEGHVRYETLDGVGDRAMAVVERADAQKGILSDIALLVMQRGDRQVVFMSSDLARRDRAAALAALAQLGKAAANRL